MASPEGFRKKKITSAQAISKINAEKALKFYTKISTELHKPKKIH